MRTTLANEPELVLGAGRLLPPTCEFVYPGGAETLEPQVVQVLLVLGRSEGRVVSRDALIAQCWGGRSVSEDAINRVISRIRRLSKQTGAFGLTTIRSVGYRLDPTQVTTTALGGRSDPETLPEPHLTEAGRARRQGWPIAGAIVLALLVVAGVGLAVWPGGRATDPASTGRAAGYTIAILSSPASGSSDEVRKRLADRLRLAVSQMHGMRVVDAGLIDGAGKRPATDLLLSGHVTADAKGEAISLSLDDGRTGVRIWGATFDARNTPGRATEDRAISSATRYLALWLGDRRAGLPAAREPENPDVLNLVGRADRTYAQATEARELGDWSTSRQLDAQARRLSDEALTLEPSSVAALMLRYRVSITPRQPREGEDVSAFQARQARATDAVDRALAINPDDPEVLIAAAAQFESARRWADSKRLLERAIALSPNSADANTWYAYAASLSGHCDEGLRHAQIAAALEPERTWRQMAVPRLLQCSGRSAEATTAYLSLVRRDRTHVVVLGDLLLTLLGNRDPSELRAVSKHVRERVWAAAPTPLISARLARFDAAADALEGRPQRYLGMIRQDEQEVRGRAPSRAGFTRTLPDALFVLAYEYAHAGAPEDAMRCLAEAVRGGSLYLPWALPHGASEFPQSVRQNPRYFALWRSSPQLAALMEVRRRARVSAPAVVRP